MIQQRSFTWYRIQINLTRNIRLYMCLTKNSKSLIPKISTFPLNKFFFFHTFNADKIRAQYTFLQLTKTSNRKYSVSIKEIGYWFVKNTCHDYDVIKSFVCKSRFNPISKLQLILNIKWPFPTSSAIFVMLFQLHKPLKSGADDKL